MNSATVSNQYTVSTLADFIRPIMTCNDREIGRSACRSNSQQGGSNNGDQASASPKPVRSQLAGLVTGVALVFTLLGLASVTAQTAHAGGVDQAFPNALKS
ncbi:hypothetical protein [Mycobacterium gastri]|uniref:Uncharacterized protein n=1 Tax=Mycobacterium gastri TaxID=1777 RepID=A0A1X1VVI8_MYCGS|nr:hypothetical protein [Mycobacterium gastri]ETW21693.1 hypothetical protein MGAST_24370 [Mycobacterium gastri 'Wayne']ORV73055.1 hypothetical protein AWC07_02995 [Mycobacterium gastri]